MTRRPSDDVRGLGTADDTTPAAVDETAAGVARPAVEISTAVEAARRTPPPDSSAADDDAGPAAPGATTVQGTRPPPQPRRKVSWCARFKRDRSLILMTMPAVVLLAVFAYIPIAGNVVAWQDYSPFIGIGDSPWVGWYNFQRLFVNDAFWHAVGNTLLITAFQLVFFFPIPIAMALLLNSVMTPRVRTTIQSIVYLPHFFSWVIVVTVFQQIFGGAGFVAQRLADLGYSGFDLMTDPDTFLVLLTMQSVWKDAGWGMIIFLAALSTVDPALYEASVVDGANRWRRIWHITLPALRPTIILLLILRLGDALTVGFEQLILQRGAVGVDAAEVLDTFVYYQGVINGDWSFAAAAGLLKGVVSLVLVLGANKLAHVFGEAGVYKRA